GVEDPKSRDVTRLVRLGQQQDPIREHSGMPGANGADARRRELEIQARGLNDRVVIAERLPLLEVHGAPVYVYRRRDHGSPAIPVLAELDLAYRPARGRVRALPSGAGGV